MGSGTSGTRETDEVLREERAEDVIDLRVYPAGEVVTLGSSDEETADEGDPERMFWSPRRRHLRSMVTRRSRRACVHSPPPPWIERSDHYFDLEDSSELFTYVSAMMGLEENLRPAAAAPPQPAKVIATVDLSLDFVPTPVINEVIVIDSDAGVNSPATPETPELPAAVTPDRIRSCPICLERFSARRQLTSTFCGHVFCKKCVTAVMKTTKKCPTCRKHLKGQGYHLLYI